MIPIEKRTVYVVAHNTWRNLATGDNCIIVEPDRTGVCKGEHSVTLSKYIEDSLVGLTFRVEFEALLPTRPARPVKLVVAWDVYMPQINSQGEVTTQNIDLRDCKIGNGTSVGNDLVWGNQSTLSGDANLKSRHNFKINIRAKLSTDKSGKSRPSIDTRHSAQSNNQTQSFPFQKDPARVNTPSRDGNRLSPHDERQNFNGLRPDPRSPSRPSSGHSYGKNRG